MNRSQPTENITRPFLSVRRRQFRHQSIYAIMGDSKTGKGGQTIAIERRAHEMPVDSQRFGAVAPARRLWPGGNAAIGLPHLPYG